MPPVRRRVRAALANLGVEPRQRTKRSTPPATHTGSIPVKKTFNAHFNALPSAPESSRPPLELFVWGTGGAGEFGVGRAADFETPHRNEVVHRMIQQDKFGDVGAQAGLQTIAAGGMHTLFIDEKGAVSRSSLLSRVHNDLRHLQFLFKIGLVLWTERRRCFGTIC